MSPKLPPRWFIRGAWVAHRALTRVTADKVGLARPTPGGRFGILRLHTVGRRSGKPRAVLLGYIDDGDSFVTLAMNGWDRADPAWWLNLQSAAEATVDLVGESRPVVAHAATGADRDRLWVALHQYAGYGDLDAFAAGRGRETAVVVLAAKAADRPTGSEPSAAPNHATPGDPEGMDDPSWGRAGRS